MNAKTIKILLDKQIFSMPYGGISRLFTEMPRLGKEKYLLSKLKFQALFFILLFFIFRNMNLPKFQCLLFFQKNEFKRKVTNFGSFTEG